MKIIGIDPGLSGGIALYDNGDYWTNDMPVFMIERNRRKKRDIDIPNLVVLLKSADHAFVEQVGAMPKQGVSSTFAFGKGYGIILGILGALEIPVTLVTPQRWKKALGVPKGKDAARMRASQLLPGCADQWPLKKHDGRAEAAMIAYYGRREL